MINYLSLDLRSPLGASHKLVCLVAKNEPQHGGNGCRNGSGRTVTKQGYYPACLHSSSTTLIPFAWTRGNGPIRQVPSISNLLSVTARNDRWLAEFLLHKLFSTWIILQLYGFKMTHKVGPFWHDLTLSTQKNPSLQKPKDTAAILGGQMWPLCGLWSF